MTISHSRHCTSIFPHGKFYFFNTRSADFNGHIGSTPNAKAKSVIE
jgi:hypothetical protein